MTHHPFFFNWGQKSASVPVSAGTEAKYTSAVPPGLTLCAHFARTAHTPTFDHGASSPSHLPASALGSPSDAHSARPSILPFHRRQLSAISEANLLTHLHQFPPLKHICPRMSSIIFYHWPAFPPGLVAYLLISITTYSDLQPVLNFSSQDPMPEVTTKSVSPRFSWP